MERLKHDNFDCAMRHRTNCRGRTTNSSVTVTITVVRKSEVSSSGFYFFIVFKAAVSMEMPRFPRSGIRKLLLLFLANVFFRF